MLRILFIYIFVELLFVSIIDYRSRKVSNWWSVVHLAIFSVITLFLSINPWSWEGPVYASVFLAIGFALFSLNIMGAGDVKFISTLFLLIPAQFLFPFFINMLYATILVGSTLLTFSLVKHYNGIISAIAHRDVKTAWAFFGSKFAFIPIVFMAWIALIWQNRNQIF